MLTAILAVCSVLSAQVTTPLPQKDGQGGGSAVQTIEDLDTAGVRLPDPENLKRAAEYDSIAGDYRVGMKLGSTFLDTPFLMSQEEYQQWTMQQSMRRFYRDKNREEYASKGKKKFDFADMQFDLGPAEKIFGPGGVSIKTQGSAELKVGINMKNVDNPSLAASRRKTTGFDFDEKINLSVTAKVGDKVNMNINYNTEATFDVDAQNMKLKYDGKEDEIIKKVEAGNIDLPSNSTLVRGISGLFGLRTDLQFGKLKLQTAISQKKSASRSVTSKGGVQTTAYEISAADYDENRHFWLAHYFRENYDRWMRTLPTIASGIQIKRVEVWVTNKRANVENNRNLIAFTDLGEGTHIANPHWKSNGIALAANRANTLYDEILQQYPGARDISQSTTILDEIEGCSGGSDYEKLQSARKLTSSEYTVNETLGYITLSTTLQPDEVLAVAFEYTYGGQAYQVGEFASDLTDNSQCLYVKALKNTSGSPKMGNWPLMMKNVYALGPYVTSTQREKFRLDIKYQSDSTGVYLTYLPEEGLKSTTLLRALNLDRLDNNNKTNPDGQFDYIDGYTISKGHIYFPVAEPFGDHLRHWISNTSTANRYCFDALYDSTKTVAKQIAEQNKFILTGQYKGTNGAEIDLGANNITQGSVHVTAGGVELTENVDYRVDYSMGIVTIINQSIIDSGQKVSANVESDDTYGMQRKTMLGVNWDYEFSKNLVIGGTLQFLNEQPMTTKVSMGNEPLKNTLWGAHIDWKRESQWLTNALNAIPLLNFTTPSHISFSAEFAQLIAGQNHKIQGRASYMDDFENTKNRIGISTPTSWMLSSVPTGFEGAQLTSDVRSGYQRALLAWYYIDPIFTRRSSSLTPSHIKSDLQQLSNHYVREVYERELYPNKSQNTYSEAVSLNVLNLAYYPDERGAYNLNPNLNERGRLINPKQNWGGMMRKTESPDFEAQNIEYMEFWMLDPFIYSGDDDSFGGELYIDLGEVSEDVLKDGKKFYESGLPTDDNPIYYEETVWGRVPTSNSVTYAFNNESGSREKQDVGLNGLNSEQERSYGAYAEFLAAIQGTVSPEVFDSIAFDPAADNYHYYRGSDFDRDRVSILDRYKHINLPEGNSPDADNSPESYETAYKTTPDIEDINQDYTLNEYEKFYRYHISIHPGDTLIGRNHIADIRHITPKLRNGEREPERWFQFRVPLEEYEKAEGGISDFTSIRYIRMFLTGFEKPVILRFATLDLVQADWRSYEQSLLPGVPPSNALLEVSAVNIEENNDKLPVNYVLPPGVSRVTDPAQTQLVESNEQALSLVVKNMQPGDSRAVFKNCHYDMRQYKHLQMFVHANALANDITELQDGETSLFIRFGSDYRINYYEYEIPLVLTPEGHYDTYSAAGCAAVWPEENMLDIDLSLFTAVKKARNREKSLGNTTNSQPYSEFDPEKPSNKITVTGNPTLGEVKTIMIGVRNNGRTVKSVEVWANELRLQEFSNDGGWAAQGTLNIQLSDLGSVNVQGHYEKAGFGGIEQTVSERSNDNTFDYAITTQMDLGKLLPPKAKVSFPFFYSYSKETIKPKYNPLDTDMLLVDALDAATTQQEKDSITSLTTQKQVNKSISFNGVKVNIQSRKHPMPYDPANFTFNYSHSHAYSMGETTVYDHERAWRGGLNYSWSPNWKAWEPFKQIKSKSKWLELVKAINFNFAPQSLSFTTDITRTYSEIQERDMDNLDNPSAIPVRWTPSFLWNRDFNLRWDLTKSLHFTFQSGTHAEIEEPYMPVNKDLYPDLYTVWKDSVMRSLRSFGTPIDYQQSAQASYKLPLEKIPLFDWLSADATYQSNYSWRRVTALEDGTEMGNNINTQRTLNFSGKLNMETLYNHWDFLKEANKRFSTSQIKSEGKKKDAERKKAADARNKAKAEEAKKRAQAEQQAAAGDSTALKALNEAPKMQTNARGETAQKKQVKGFAGEVTLLPDSSIALKHGQKSKRIRVTARTADGQEYRLRYKVTDDNTILIQGPKSPKKKKEKSKTNDMRRDSLALDATFEKAKKRITRSLAADSLALASALDSLDRARTAAIDSLTRAYAATLDNLTTDKDAVTPSPANPDDAATTATPDTTGLGAPRTRDDAPAIAPIPLRVNVVAKPKLEDETWYKLAQAGARFLMMLRNASISYRNTYALAIQGFRPNVGDLLGQHKSPVGMAPGIDFAFGLVGDRYLERANERGWLITADSIAKPATTNAAVDLQIKASIEPLPDLKIDLNASWTRNRSKSIQFIYDGNPATETGTFNMTTISIATAFASRGNADNGYDSKPFRRFQDYLTIMQQRVESQYAGVTYPQGTGQSGTFNHENGTVDRFSADVMVPAFLAAYTGRSAITSPLDIFPKMIRMLPNWSLNYKGLSNLPWVRDHLKSLTLTHAYKSVYSIGSYNTFSSWIAYMGGGEDLGFVQNATTGLYQPSSPYDITTVSINEAFSPLVGLNATLQNNMTLKLEYRKTRVLTLSMTSAQINEASSSDIVFGFGYKINDFKIGSLFGSRGSSAKASSKSKKSSKNSKGKGKNSDTESSSTSRNRDNASSGSRSNNFAHDLNLRFDFSLRNQDAITRNIQTSLSEATSGNRAIKASFAADYAMSRYVTLTLYYDRQRNQPLLSTSSYPTITQDFGINMRFSLTR